jgi:hypothetical protein
MSAREWAAICMARAPGAVVALGLLGMLGFVVSLFLMSAGWLNLAPALSGILFSLGLYGTSLLIGHLSDPGAQLEASAKKKAAQPAARQEAQVPRSSWTWPVRWKPKLSATSR